MWSGRVLYIFYIKFSLYQLSVLPTTGEHTSELFTHQRGRQRRSAGVTQMPGIFLRSVDCLRSGSLQTRGTVDLNIPRSDLDSSAVLCTFGPFDWALDHRVFNSELLLISEKKMSEDLTYHYKRSTTRAEKPVRRGVRRLTSPSAGSRARPARVKIYRFASKFFHSHLHCSVI